MLVRLPNKLWAVSRFKLDATHFGFILLDINHFLDRLSQVKFLYDLPEFSCIYLSKVKEIFHEEVHHAGRGILNLAA